jgi:hypothetical protein
MILLFLNFSLFSEEFEFKILEHKTIEIICDNILEINTLISNLRLDEQYQDFDDGLHTIFEIYVSELFDYDREIDLNKIKKLNKIIDELIIPDIMTHSFESIMLEKNNFRDYLIITFAYNFLVYEKYLNDFLEGSEDENLKSELNNPITNPFLNNIEKIKTIFNKETLDYIISYSKERNLF